MVGNSLTNEFPLWKQLHHHAEFAAATIPHAELVSFERGGHVLMAVEQATIRELLQEHILEHLEQPAA